MCGNLQMLLRSLKGDKQLIKNYRPILLLPICGKILKLNEQKHLGLILASSLPCKKHLTEKIIKAKKNLGIIKHLSMFLSRKTLDQMYKALVRSHLDYCDIIYHISSIQTQLVVTLTDLNGKC